VYARGDARGPLAVSWFGLGVAGEVDKLVISRRMGRGHQIG